MYEHSYPGTAWWPTGALAIDRLGSAGERPIEWRHILIRGDWFSLIAGFSQCTGCQLHLDSRYADLRPAS